MGGYNDHGRLGVNGHIDFEKAPKSEIGEVMQTSLVVHVREGKPYIGTHVPMHGPKNDVQDAYRKIQSQRENAPVLAHVVEEFVAVDVRLAFRWRNSPGWRLRSLTHTATPTRSHPGEK